MTDAVTLPRSVVERYRKFSRFNSPYPAHGAGHAIDLYPGDGRGLSPVSGVVQETHTVGCPDRPYAADTDHVIVIGLDRGGRKAIGAEPGTIARILHVVPEVKPGDRVAIGDVLGPTTRSGFFGRWVDDHVHLELRPPGSNPLRASGSLPVDVDVAVEPVRWDGTGTVIERGAAHVVLDALERSSGTAARFASLASDEEVPLDGGLAHYAGGGTFEREPNVERESSVEREPDEERRTGKPGGSDHVSLLGTTVGARRGRGIEWEPIEVIANGERIVGLSLFASRNERIGVKLVCPDAEFRIGDVVSVEIRASDDPIRLGVGR